MGTIRLGCRESGDTVRSVDSWHSESRVASDLAVLAVDDCSTSSLLAVPLFELDASLSQSVVVFVQGLASQQFSKSFVLAGELGAALVIELRLLFERVPEVLNCGEILSGA